MNKLLLTTIVAFSFIANSTFAQIDSNKVNDAKAKITASDFSGAVSELTPLITANEKSTQEYVKKLQAYLAMTAYQKALLSPSQVVKVNHNLATPYYVRGFAYSKLEQNDSAIKDFTMAVNIDPKYGDAYYERALIKKASKDKDGSCIDLRLAAKAGNSKALELYNDDFCWTSGVKDYKAGLSQFQLHQFREALGYFNSAVALSPDSAGFLAKRGETYMELNILDSALIDLSQAKKIDSTNFTVMFTLGQIYAKKQQYKDAFSAYTAAIGINGMSADTYMARAGVCDLMNQSNSAIYDYGQVIRLKPNDGTAYFKRAGIEDQLDEKYAACTDYKKAAALGDDEAADYAAGCK
ncbi:MAG TPA: tetratricopeptide repeat protein [Bacteroidia bacterium]|nr:tetratricopeptide repeat protein [Bacteroidia bacterium]